MTRRVFFSLRKHCLFIKEMDENINIDYLRKYFEEEELDIAVSGGNCKMATYILENLKLTLSVIMSADLCPKTIFKFVEKGYTDQKLPLSNKTMNTIFQDQNKIKAFQKMLSRKRVINFGQGEHKKIEGRFDLVPFRKIKRSKVRNGRFGKVDQVSEGYYDNDKLFARKTIDRCEQNDQIIARELEIYKKLPMHVHLLSLRASYEQNNQIMLILDPWAEYNLEQFQRAPTDMIFWNTKTKNDQLNLIINWMLCMVSTLGFLHQYKIKHIDLKPDNILLKEKDNWVVPILGDLGLAKRFSKTSKSVKKEGNLFYQSPEQFDCQLVGRKADIFSLGCIFLELSFLIAGKRRKEITEKLIPEGQKTYAASIEKLEEIFTLLPGDRKLLPKLIDVIRIMMKQEQISCNCIVKNIISIVRELNLKMKCNHEAVTNNSNSSSPNSRTSLDDISDTEDLSSQWERIDI